MAAPLDDVHGADSFGQLPLIGGPASAVTTTPPARDATIRLFGREFSNDQLMDQPRKEEDGDGAGERKQFECHYCCRNFPTSQALGGHQNAHKRERQHARRAHLEATFAAHYLPGYGLFGYGGGGGHFHQQAMSALPPHYQVWAAGAVPGVYGGVGSVARPPVYGASVAVPGMWRPPPAGSGAFGAYGRSEGTELAGKDDKVVMSVVTSLPSCLSAGQSPEKIGIAELGRHKDGVVSLDLCL